MAKDVILSVNRLRDLDFEYLMRVYEEGNRENGRCLYAKESEEDQLRLAQQDFFDYLQYDFFRQPDAAYWILQVEDQYVCALRTELFQDGYLIQALETMPFQRRCGYATRLLDYVVRQLHETTAKPIYSHVQKRNRASLTVHAKCGFAQLKDFAAYIDGSVSNNAYTLVYR